MENYLGTIIWIFQIFRYLKTTSSSCTFLFLDQFTQLDYYYFYYKSWVTSSLSISVVIHGCCLFSSYKVLFQIIILTTHWMLVVHLINRAMKKKRNHWCVMFAQEELRVSWVVDTSRSSLIGRVAGSKPHLSFILDGLFSRLPLLFTFFLVSWLSGDARQVGVVDSRHALRLLGRQAPFWEDVQRDARLTGHADRLRLKND